MSKITIYTAMWNLPGCLPEMEPFRTLNEETAREYLADELEEVADQSHDDREGPTEDALVAATAIRNMDEAKPITDSVAVAGLVYTLDSGDPIDDDEARRAGLAEELGCELGDVAEARYGDNAYEADGGEYLILDDDEAEVMWDEYLDSYLDDCVLCELEGALAQYFDREAWKRDARHDGRGHSLSGYDGVELELGGGFFAYRTN